MKKKSSVSASSYDQISRVIFWASVHFYVINFIVLYRKLVISKLWTSTEYSYHCSGKVRHNFLFNIMMEQNLSSQKLTWTNKKNLIITLKWKAQKINGKYSKNKWKIKPHNYHPSILVSREMMQGSTWSHSASVPIAEGSERVSLVHHPVRYTPGPGDHQISHKSTASCIFSRSPWPLGFSPILHQTCQHVSRLSWTPVELSLSSITGIWPIGITGSECLWIFNKW